MKTRSKRAKTPKIIQVTENSEDRPWETTPFMIQQKEARRNSPYFSYGYNPTTGKVERI